MIFDEHPARNERTTADVARAGEIDTGQNGTPERSGALRRLVAERAVEQLRRREGLMATLGSEAGAVKLDWVEGVARLLADGAALEEVEAEARGILGRGVRHVIWAGMGGSVMTVRVLTDIGFLNGDSSASLTVYPLDSTDPAALNAIVRDIARTEGLDLPATGRPAGVEFLRTLLGTTMMIGVSMGMTSEEPITHLEWFLDLLQRADLSPAEHCLIMTLPGSYLDRFAAEHHLPAHPLQLDGGAGTPGRMSAPTTRVFLLPAALALVQADGTSGRLRSVLRRAWQAYNLQEAVEYPDQHPSVRLAAALSDASREGVVRLLLRMPGEWQALVPWIEQLMEESLGKGGKGVLVFGNQALPEGPDALDRTVRVRMGAAGEAVEDDFWYLNGLDLGSPDPEERLVALATSFLGWQLVTALYGYLQGITFAGQPAVEDYKARARVLRTHGQPLEAAYERGTVIREGRLSLLPPPGLWHPGTSAITTYVDTLRQMLADEGLDYLELTINGELPPAAAALLEAEFRYLGNECIRVPVKFRRAPAAYHSTEQSEMDGPPGLVSLRLLTRLHEASILGAYDDVFLAAQAVGTWQAMVQEGRSCFLLVVDGLPEDGVELLTQFLSHIREALAK